MTKRTVTSMGKDPARVPAERHCHKDLRIFVCALVLGTVPFAGVGAIFPPDPVPAQAGTAYLGEEIRLQGINTDSDVTYLFVTGPNLPPGGGRMDSPRSAVVDGDASTFTRVDVGTDGRWEYRWRTAGIGIDAGTYTVYAESTPRSRDFLTGGASSTSTFVLLGPSGMGTPVRTTVPGPSVPPVTGVNLTPETSPPAIPSTGTTVPPAAGLQASGAGIALAGVLLLLRRK